MDFWGRQEQAKRYTLILLILFISAVGFTIFVMNLLVGMVLYPFEQSGSLIVHSLTPMIIISMLVVILGGSLWEAYRLREGGRALASRLGARRIQFETTVPEERMLKNVVEEMSVASSVPMPALYVLDDELGVNAFVAGYRAMDMALVVTWGMLQTLDRHELQGVIAHEYSHIRHGDTQLNLRLVAWVAGLLTVSQLGSWIAQTGFSLQRHVQRNRHADALFIAIGGLVWLVGSLGVLMARLLKFAILRQREFLADASSMQFTRTNGVLQALLRIRTHHIGTQLHGVYTESISHFCFGQALHSNSLFATHPELDQRICEISPAALRRAKVQERILARKQVDQIEAEMAVQKEVLSLEQEQEVAPIEWHPPLPLPTVRLHPVTVNIKDAVKPLNPQMRQNAARPDVIKRALSTSAGCRELLAAILALRQQIACEPEKQQVSRAIVEALARLDPRLYTSIFLQGVDALGELPASAARQFLSRLAEIIQLDGHIGLLDVLLLERVKAKLNQLPPVVPVSLDHCGPAITFLVEALLHVQKLKPEQIAQARIRVLRTILSARQFDEAQKKRITDDPVNLGQVLHQLAGLLKRERMNILAAAETCLWSDTVISQEEQDVLDMLYWRMGFEAKALADYTARKIALEIST
ncbi:M48 family metalloprotease [Alkanindiges illinoisensis]|uniref:M48 family metalloprotease n=1 Tax=Alkanindiges illinoisensis TaxID=197183 RepID=UPI000688D5E3|nr:M48 family metalloprotease [Alkanindiges illinoisensis]